METVLKNSSSVVSSLACVASGMLSRGATGIVSAGETCMHATFTLPSRMKLCSDRGGQGKNGGGVTGVSGNTTKVQILDAHCSILLYGMARTLAQVPQQNVSYRPLRVSQTSS